MDDYSFLDGIEQSKTIKGFSQAKTFDQLGILVLDGSGSMKERSHGNKQLAEHVETAVTDFVDWFQTRSSIRANISLAIVTFDDHAREHTPITPIIEVESTRRFNPLEGHGNGTEILNGLEEAHRIAKKHLNHPNATNIPHSVVIVLMSDGLTNRPEQAIEKATEIKGDSRITICSTYFKNPNQLAAKYEKEAIYVLQGIASSQDYYRDTSDNDDLRKFFISSVSAQRKFPETGGKGSSSIFD